MKFDTIIIGGGLSGLICGIRLMQQNQRCVIISSGQSALHFSSGSFDLLNTLPDGQQVTNPHQSIQELIQQSPDHPYSKLGQTKFQDLAQQAKTFLQDIGLSLYGQSQQNHYRITPMGILKPTWLTISDFATSTQKDQLPWKKVTIFAITGFLDFYPQFIAEAFKEVGTDTQISYFSLPEIEHLRRNPSELRSTNIARELDKITNKEQLINILKNGSKDSEAIILPACIGLNNPKTLSELEQAVGKPIHLIPTLPPSIVGIRTQQYLHDYYINQGGVYMLGDNVQKAEIQNNKITKIYSYNHGDIPFQADNVILATGSYFSQGLIAARDRIYEPIFNLDVDYLTNRQDWYDPNVFNPQNYQHFGVKTDTTFKALKNNQPIDNLYVSGAILNGFNPIKEGSGAGVSILSALHIVEQIQKQKR